MKCIDCDGRGYHPYNAYNPLGWDRGKVIGFALAKRTCKKCKGTGKVNGE